MTDQEKLEKRISELEATLGKTIAIIEQMQWQIDELIALQKETEERFEAQEIWNHSIFSNL